MVKTDIYKEVEIVPGVQVTMNLPEITISGEKGSITREFSFRSIIIAQKEGKISLSAKKAAQKDKAMLNTFASHLSNMIKGVTEGFVYELKICSGHFPVTVTQEAKKIVVKNFLGEKVAREAVIPEDVNIEIKKDLITITSHNKEKAGEAATNLEKSTKIKNRDRRKFQDGIYLISKAGKAI